MSLLEHKQDTIENINRIVLTINGGTGLSNHDITQEVMERVIDRPIPSFCGLYQILSYEEIDSAHIASC